MEAGRDGDRLVDGRNCGHVSDLVNGWGVVRNNPAVGLAGRAQIGRDGQPARSFEVIAVQAKQSFRPAVQPASFEAEGGCLAHRRRGGELELR